MYYRQIYHNACAYSLFRIRKLTVSSTSKSVLNIDSERSGWEPLVIYMLSYTWRNNQLNRIMSINVNVDTMIFVSQTVKA